MIATITCAIRNAPNRPGRWKISIAVLPLVVEVAAGTYQD
jgi:hypothetical protein